MDTACISCDWSPTPPVRDTRDLISVIETVADVVDVTTTYCTLCAIGVLSRAVTEGDRVVLTLSRPAVLTDPRLLGGR